MDSIKSKIENIEKIQKQKLELQEKLNQTDFELTKLVNEVISYKQEDEKIKNKLHDFLSFFFIHIRNLNSSLAFWGISITCVILVELKKKFGTTFFIIGFVISAAPLLFSLIDILCSISKVKSKFIQVLLLFLPFLAYLIIIIGALVIFYNSFDVAQKIHQLS